MKKRSKTTEQHELTESPQEQTEKLREKKDKRRKIKTESDDNLQTHTAKKKRRKLDNEGETSVMDDGVSNQHEAQTQELQCSREETYSKRKKKREKLKQTNREDMTKEEQTEIKTEHGEEPNTRDEESDPPGVVIGTRKRASNDETMVDSKSLDELNEFCPKITLESRSVQDINKMIRYDLPRFKEFRKQGIALRHGRFSEAENKRLRQNVSDFLALTQVNDAIRLFHPKRFPNKAKKLAKLKRKYRFFERIAEGIPRPCHDVFTRGTKIYDDKNYKGNFTEEEEKSLLKYHRRYGKHWQKISVKTDRSSYSLEKRFSHLSKIKGPWTTKEVQRLLRAVRDHVVSVLKSANPKKKRPKRVSREILYQKLPWTTIAKQVKTRCWTKCRDKWMSILATRMSSGITFKGRMAQEAKIRLIKAMYEMHVEDVVDVDWEDLTAVFGDVPPAYAQLRWRHLKARYVPDWKNKCFGEIVSFLYEKTLPGLLLKCEYRDDSNLKLEQRQRFRLSRIFQDINEEDCCDSDEETGQQESNSLT
ncbi:transcription termination factor 1-like [Danio aesculapii]|uniref:transcription termination factor 1-like n=1 Tax=Danio aesculapii TaxID=1142201 RepID=UPI0024C0122D|nr:transcription termination factor 1-like [Danio aesculapii]